MGKRWVIPDIHGCPDTLKALIEEQIKPTLNDELYFLGDYIDRGPGSKEVIDYIRKLKKDGYSVTTLKGNHEDFLLELYDAEMNSKSAWYNVFGNQKRKQWFRIGGKECLKSFNVNSVKEIPVEYIEWLQGLEYYARLDEFVLVHAGLNFKHSDPYKDKHSMMWIRDYPIQPWKIQNRKIIHGHVPVTLELINLSIKTESYQFIDLDNGTYMTDMAGYGNLVSLELNEMKMVIQDNRDEVAEQYRSIEK
jgi:serine/threonine protein phosphatase 1